MSNLKQTFSQYADLPENIRWVCDRLDQLQGIQDMLNTPWEGKATAYWMQMQEEYTRLFGGDLTTDLQNFGKEYL